MNHMNGNQKCFPIPRIESRNFVHLSSNESSEKLSGCPDKDGNAMNLFEKPRTLSGGCTVTDPVSVPPPPGMAAPV